MIEHEFDGRRMLNTGGGEAMDEVAAAWGEMTASRLRYLAKLAVLDRERGFEYDGYASAAAFLMCRCGMSARRARREVFLARSMGRMRLVWAAVASGRLSFDQAATLAFAQHRFPDQFAADEEMLVDAAGGLSVGDTRRLVEHWCHLHAGPDGPQEQEPSRLYLSETMDGRGRLDGDLDRETFRVLSAALDGLTGEIVAATPKQELGSASVRRGEALKELARRHLDRGAAATDHGNRPHLIVVIDWATLTGDRPEGRSEHLDGTFLGPEDARRLACDAQVCRLITGPHSEILDLGRTRRTVSATQWRALRHRDRHCRFPGCRRPTTWCDAHHLISWWEHQGPTDLDNLILLCRHHHTLIHRRGWKLTGTATHPTFTRPDGTTLPNAPPQQPLPLPA